VPRLPKRFVDDAREPDLPIGANHEPRAPGADRLDVVGRPQSALTFSGSLGSSLGSGTGSRGGSRGTGSSSGSIV
jgi:hypothetical protein